VLLIYWKKEGFLQLVDHVAGRELWVKPGPVSRPESSSHLGVLELRVTDLYTLVVIGFKDFESRFSDDFYFYSNDLGGRLLNGFGFRRFVNVFAAAGRSFLWLTRDSLMVMSDITASTVKRLPLPFGRLRPAEASEEEIWVLRNRLAVVFARDHRAEQQGCWAVMVCDLQDGSAASVRTILRFPRLSSFFRVSDSEMLVRNCLTKTLHLVTFGS
jgi:hypothetical protein